MAGPEKPNKFTITIVSTATTDRVPVRNGHGWREIPGGPAHYIALALRQLGCPYHLITGQRVDVEVVPDSEGEHYLIPAIDLIPLPDHLSGDATILSPIMREIDPDAVPPAEGWLAVDLQGFVREPGTPTNAVGSEIDLSHLLRRCTVVKGSIEELARLTPASRAALDGVILATTMGSRGMMLRHSGREIFLSARPVRATNTIGAGDIFLGGFVYSLLQEIEPAMAARAAMRFTEEVLDGRRDPVESAT